MALPRFDLFLPLLAGIMVLGIALPLAAPLQHPLGLVSDAGVAGLFLFHGAVLKPRELWTGLGHWRLHGLTFSITFIAFPLAGAALCLAARSAGLPQDLATGLLFLTLLPSAVSSSIAFTAMAHGHVAAAMCNAAASNVAGLVLTPLLALAAASSMGGVSNAVFANPGDALLRVGLQMAAPFAMGQALRRWAAPLFSERPGRLQRYDEGVILLIVYLAVSGAAKDGLLARVSPWAFAAVALVCLGLFALAFILATLGARRLGLSRRDEIAAVFCASKKEPGHGSTPGSRPVRRGARPRRHPAPDHSIQPDPDPRRFRARPSLSAGRRTPVRHARQDDDRRSEQPMKASSGPAPTAGGSPRQETFHRRTLLLGVAGAAGMGALVLRNAQLALVDHSRFRRMADGNAYSERLIPSPRGLLLDRNGVRLAENRPSFRVLVSPEETPDLEQALDLLERVLPGAVAPRRAALLRKARLSTSTPLLVSDDLTWEAFARVNLQLGDLPGIIVDMTQVRSYPHGGVFAHVAGYVAKASQSDFDAVLRAGRRPPSIMHDPAFRIGRQGVEKALDEALRGEAGVERVKVNAHGKVIARNLPGSRPPRPGAVVRLTLDADVQRTALESFGHESGGCAVIDVESGDLLCLASSPAFDPNLFVTGVPGSVYRAWAEYERKPLLDKACGGVFHPGSTFKLVTGLALLESGIDPSETVVCTGGYAYGGRVFRCWKHSGHGRVDLEAALKTSCDVYFYHLCNRAGVDRIAEVAHRLGLGERFEIEAPSQRSGVIPTAAWKAHYNRAHADPSTRRWYPGETLSVAIGQGDVAVSALQLAVMTARIANGRQAVTPRLVAAIGGSPLHRPHFAQLGFSPAHIDQVRRGMYAVSNDPGGGAFRQSRLGLGDIKIAGKTGTAQVRSYGAGPRTSNIWRLKDHNLFVAYAPWDRPRYAVSVIVEHGGRGGATAAAPRALEVLRTALIKDPQVQARLTQPAK